MFRGLLQSIKTRGRIVGYLFRFLWQNKLWWMIPLVAVLLGFFILLIVGQSSPLGPFIYAIF